jgi:hypothetical protein
MSQGVIEAKPDRAKGTWKQRIAREFIRYWINVAYLAVFFGAFAWYRRFVLAEYGITYLHYGSAIIEALILAKVVLVGDALGLSRGLKNKPLIYPTLHKTVVFSVFVGIFAIVEHVVEGLVHGKGVAEGLAAQVIRLFVRAGRKVDERDGPGVRAGKIGSVRGDSARRYPMRFVRFEPYVIPKRNLTGDGAERVDTRVLQVIFALEKAAPVYAGQQMDVFIDGSESKNDMTMK